MHDPLDLTGRVAIVTGATRGIGKAIAETLAAHGAALVLNAHSQTERLTQVAEEISKRHSVPVAIVPGDVSNAQTSATLAKEAFSRHRRLDIWVNNAGLMIDGVIGMVQQKDIDAVLGVNLAGVLHGVQAAARLMQRGRQGSIINLTSIMGRFGAEKLFVYGASKAGVIGATLCAAKELAPKNIRVNAIAPGFIDTDMVRHLPESNFAERLASIRIGRIGSPQDVAEVVLFLASDLSSYVTGQIIGVDGGMIV
jgi:3-oxoacyl-[acyl-carrier protein] reductase